MKQLLLTAINLVFDVTYILIVARAFLTYLPHNKLHPLIKPLYNSTEPFLSVIRKGLPPNKIGIDASPFIALLLLYLVQQLLLMILASI